MSSRKILILTNRIPYPLKDGGNLAMNAMIEGYYRAGWQVYLLSMNTTRHFVPGAQLKQLFTHLYAFEWVKINNDLTWVGVLKNFFFSREPEHAKRFYHHEFKVKLDEVLDKFQPDVVQVESVYLSTYLPEINKHSHALTILRLHNIEYQIWQGLAKKSRNLFKKIYLETLTKRVRDFEREAWKEYDLLLPITEKDAKLIARLEDVNDMIVAPFSIDMSAIQPHHSQEKWVGYHIGAMDWLANKEGIKWFISEAWPKIQKVVPGFEFYFAGRNMPPEFKDLDIKGVHCLNEVPSAQDFIADKKILIVPISSAGGVRVKILEAMAAGKVIISTSIGIKGIEANAGEHYLSARKAEDFAKNIKWCIDNKEAAEQMAQKAHDLVREKYEHNVVINNVISELETLLGSDK
jgi:polysaccharide biosynthesis protein PslH